MCRLALYASTKSCHGFEELLECFRLGSLNDFVLDSYRRGRRVHPHGWGYAYVYQMLNDMGFAFYKTSLPIFSDVIIAPEMSKYFDWIVFILHSRLTSGEPIDVLNSHPYYFNRLGEISIWLAHNGALDKGKIVEKLSAKQLAERYSDSYFLTQFIGKNITTSTKENIIEVLNNIIELNVVESSLNIVAIILDEVKKEVIGLAVNYVAEKAINMFDYYRLYRVDVGGSTVVITSSTIALYLNKLYNFAVEPLDNNTVVFVHPRKDTIDIEVRKLGR